MRGRAVDLRPGLVLRDAAGGPAEDGVGSAGSADELVVSSGLARTSAYPADWRPRFAAAYRAELSAWVDAALHGRLPEDAATAEDALRTTVVAEALVRSMNDGGRRVSVPALDEVLAKGR